MKAQNESSFTQTPGKRIICKRPSQWILRCTTQKSAEIAFKENFPTRAGLKSPHFTQCDKKLHELQGNQSSRPSLKSCR